MGKCIDIEKIKVEIERLKQENETSDDKEYAQYELDVAAGYDMALDEILSVINSLQQEQLETDMVSPFTGGKVAILSREEEVTFRGEKINVIRKYYRCVDTGREFTDSKLDEDMMWTVFRAYCEKKGITSFTDIMLKQNQPEVDLEKELGQWRHKHFRGKRDGDYNGEYLERESQLDLARHFYKLGKARKEE